jgi:hypothetical protein
MMPAAELRTIDRWFNQLYAGIPGDEWLTLFAIDRTTGERHTHWARIRDYETLAIAADDLADRCCIWFGVATRRTEIPGRRGTASDCVTVPGLWVDLDYAGEAHTTDKTLPPDRDAAMSLLADYPLEPTYIIDSGHGIQAWWLHTEPQPADETAATLDAWAHTWNELGRRRGWHVDNVFDLARVMRLPGTINHKTQPRPVTITSDSGHRYGVDDLEQHMLEPPLTPQPPPRPAVPYIGPARPGDAFNAQRTAGDVLKAAGWTFHHTDNIGEHWTRPGKDIRQGASATVYPDDGHCIVWTDATNLEVRRSYDPFGLFSHLFHGGNWTAATNAATAAGYGTQPVDIDAWMNRIAAAETATTEEPDTDQATPPPAAETLELVTVDHLRSHRPQRPPDLAAGLITQGEFTVIAAERNLGKSWWVMQLAMMLGRGEGRFLDEFDITQPWRTLYLNGEGDLHASGERWWMLADGQPTPNLYETADRPYIRLLKVRRPGIDGSSTEEYVADIDHRLEATIAAHQIQVVIIDPWAVFFRGNENSNDEAETALAELNRLTTVYGCTFILVHHIRKGGDTIDAPEDAWRGASRLADWAANRITLSQWFTPKQAKEKGLERREARRYARMTVLRRSAVPPADLRLRRDEAVWRTEPHDAATFDADWNSVADLFPCTLADLKKHLGLHHEKVDRLLERWETEKRVVVGERRNGVSPTIHIAWEMP